MEDPNEYDVVLTKITAEDRFKVWWRVRYLTLLDGVSAKRLIDNLPQTLKTHVTDWRAESIRQEFAEVGGIIEVKRSK
jgi:ribosomal protein L7/L12